MEFTEKIQKYLRKFKNNSAELVFLPKWAQKDLKGLRIFFIQSYLCKKVPGNIKQVKLLIYHRFYIL